MTDKVYSYSVVGKRQPRIDGPIKVTGQAQFTDDVTLPGMLYGKIVRSSIPRGKIVNIDISKAEKLPGVKAVITHKDITIPDSGEPLLCGDVVNYIGDGIAAVAAIDEDTAYEAAKLIKVDYEPLPAVFSIEEATAPGTPVIHKDHQDNYAAERSEEHGAIDQAFEEAEYIREGKYKLSPQHNTFAEHHIAIADYSQAGKLTMWTPCASPPIYQMLLAYALGIPKSNVRVINQYTGSAFSGRTLTRNHHYIAAILSGKASKPVKIRCTADEEFLVYKGSREQEYTVKIGMMKDGSIKAMELDVLGDCGAYVNVKGSMWVFGYAGNWPALYYRLDALRAKARLVYTNNTPLGYHHGGGVPLIRAGMEAELDLAGEDLGIDPVEIRLRNAREKGYIDLINTNITSCGLRECIEKASTSAGWKGKYGKLPPYKGIGIACAGINAGGKTPAFDHDTSFAFIKVGDDGKVFLFTGLPELGQGGHTALTMIAAETLGVPVDDITVVSGDTNVAPFDVGAWNQRGTFITGNAVKAACLDAKQQLAKAASSKLGVDPSDLIFHEGKVYPMGLPDKALSFADVVSETLHAKDGSFVMGKGFYNHPSEYDVMPMTTPAFSFGAQVAEVEVDQETGVVTLQKVTVAYDVGFAINPLAVEGQFDGQVFSGMAQALFEECIMKKGKVMNPSLLNYKLPRPFEMPGVERIIVESIDPGGPFGAKEVGEGPLVGSSAAIASAVRNAIGCQISEFPITPERVLRALKQKKKDQD